MKRIINKHGVWGGIRAFSLVFFCLGSVSILFAAPENQTPVASPAEPAEGVRVTIDCGKVLNTMRGGIGASWHAMEADHVHAGSAWGAYPAAEDEKAWQQIYRHASWLGLDWNRVEIEQNVYEPERDQFDFDNPEMRILYRILDWNQANNTDVFFQQMWCNAKWLAFPKLRDDPIGRVRSAPNDLEAFAEGLATLMEHLIKKRGYTCIKWLAIVNEPGADFSWWQGPDLLPLCIRPGLVAVRKALDARGLDLPLSGPDTTTSFPEQVPGYIDCVDVVNAYDFHDYGLDFDHRGWGHLSHFEKNAAKWATYAHADNKPLFFSEFGSFAYGWQRDVPGPSTPPAILVACETVVRMANAGVDGFNRWSFLNRGDLDGQWQLLDTWDRDKKKMLTEYAPHSDGYFGFGLLPRFIAKNSAVLSSAVEGGKVDKWNRVHSTAFRSPAGQLTLVVVNDAPSEYPMQLAVAGLSKETRLYRYRYGVPEHFRTDIKVSPQAEYVVAPDSNGITDTLPATSMTLYSTYRLEHDMPGIIVERPETKTEDGRRMTDDG